MADEESGAGAPPRPGGEENPEARKKSTAKKKPGKTEAKLATCKSASAASKTSEKPKTAPPPSAKPDAARSGPTMPAGSGATPSYGESSESENTRGGFLTLWGPATMLVFVVLIFRFMGTGDAERAVAERGATQALSSSGQENTGSGSSGDLNQLDSTVESGPNWSSPGGIMDAIRSATPDQITAALQAARSAMKRTPGESDSADSASPAAGAEGAGSSAAPPPPGGFDNPWAPTGSEAWVTGAEPPPPPSGQQPYAAQPPGYPPTMPPQGYAQYGWQPMPQQGYGPPAQGYGPPAQGQYPPQYYPTMPPQGAYPPQPYWGQQPYGGQQPYAGPQPYAGQQPYPPPPPGY